ncbi:MAG TPA: protein kinase, partial [Urbifossiella sp.]
EAIQNEFVSPGTAIRSDLAAKGTRGGHTAETKLNRPDATGEYRGTPELTGELLSSPDATGELVSSPDSTGEFGGNPDVTGELLTSPDNTMDQATEPDRTGEHIPGEAAAVHVAPKKKPAAGALPETVAGYEILGVLGRGAMGVVYKARQRGLQRLVALKMILSGEHASEHDLGRFRGEANAVAQLHHPGIVQIYEVGEDEGRPFFSLEFIDGPSLHKKLQGTPLPPKEIADLMRQMAEAMHYAHTRGVIHRDLKPANVMLTSDGIPKIGDFGLAKRLEDDESGMTKTGTVLGTPSYMSPEQALGLNAQVGPLADVYSLGAMLYDMLTGRPPFRGTSVMDTLQQLRTREPVPPIQLQPGVPRDLETICLKCLEKDKTKRYADAGELAADLKRFQNGEPILARPISRIEHLWRWCKRNPGKAATAAAAIAGVVVYAASVSILAGMLSVQKQEAVVAKGEAVKAQGEAEINAAEAIHQKGIAEDKQHEAERQTETTRQTAIVTIKGMVDIVQELQTQLANRSMSINANPEFRKVRASLLADARTKLAAITRQIQSTATATFADLFAAQLIGELLMKLGQSTEPREIFEGALKSAEQRVKAEPDNDRARANLGVIERQLGLVALDMDGDPQRALSRFQNARKVHEEVKLHPRSGQYTPMEINLVIGHDDINLGRALVALGRAAEAKVLFQEALSIRTEWLGVTPKSNTRLPRSYMMQARMWLGIASSSLNDAAGVKENFAAAIALGQSLLKDYPADPEYPTDLADVLGSQGDALLRLGQLDEAQKCYTDSLGYLKQVLAKLPDDISHQPLLALTHERLGHVHALLNEQPQSLQNFKVAAQLRKELWQIEDRNLSWQIAFVLGLARAGVREEAVTRFNIIHSRMTKSSVLMLQVARCAAIFARDNKPDRKQFIAQAISALAAATGGDFKDAAVLTTDPDLSALREEAGFKDLIAKIRAR